MENGNWIVGVHVSWKQKLTSSQQNMYKTCDFQMKWHVFDGKLMGLKNHGKMYILGA